MTDEQIIIDGVDVSGCPHYQTIGYLSQEDEGVEDYCNLFAYSCKNVNCHYKKWQRKEQECEYLKKKLLRKEAVVEFASCPSYGYSDNTIEATCSKIFCYDVNSCEHKTMVNYEQTLIKLREIAEEIDCKNPDKCWLNDISVTGDCWGCEPDKWEEPNDLAECPSKLAHIILQKIDEVLYVENN